MINSVIVLILTFFLNRFDLLDWTLLKRIPSYLISNLFTLFLVSGILFLSIGIIIFKAKRLNQIIEKYN